MIILDIKDIKNLISKVGVKEYFVQLIEQLEKDFLRWDDFEKRPRVASHFKNGVIELMPTHNEEFYSFKYVNGHPLNPHVNRPSVMATGQLSLVSTGEPLLFSEMTLLTAFRTASVSALAAKYLAPRDSRSLALIGTGAQAEFQCLAMASIFNIEEVRYFDIDSEAMKKFESNLKDFSPKLVPCSSIKEVIQGADIISTMTAAKKTQVLLDESMIEKPVFINAIGGDCPGKTELSLGLLKKSKIVIEFLEQTLIEGEIQNLENREECIELHEIIRGKKQIHNKEDYIIIFDSVGFAIEDYSALLLTYNLAKKHNIGRVLDIVPNLKNVKNLFSLLQ